jgi:hypothetical protein
MLELRIHPKKYKARYKIQWHDIHTLISLKSVYRFPIHAWTTELLKGCKCHSLQAVPGLRLQLWNRPVRMAPVTEPSLAEEGDISKGGKVHVKLYLCFSWAPHYERVLGKWRYNFMHSWTSVVDGSGWSASPPSRFTPGKESLVAIG